MKEVCRLRTVCDTVNLEECCAGKCQGKVVCVCCNVWADQCTSTPVLENQGIHRASPLVKVSRVGYACPRWREPRGAKSAQRVSLSRDGSNGINTGRHPRSRVTHGGFLAVFVDELSSRTRIDQLSALECVRNRAMQADLLFRNDCVASLLCAFALVNGTVEIKADRTQPLDDGFVLNSLRRIIGQSDRSEDERPDLICGDACAPEIVCQPPASAFARVFGNPAMRVDQLSERQRTNHHSVNVLHAIHI